MNSSVWKDNARVSMFGRIKSEFQCLEDKIKISVFERI